jgi:hypothetical protein
MQKDQPCFISMLNSIPGQFQGTKEPRKNILALTRVGDFANNESISLCKTFPAF